MFPIGAGTVLFWCKEKKKKWQKKNSGCNETLTRFSSACHQFLGSALERVRGEFFFSWFFSFLCLCMKMKTKWQILSILFVQLSMYVVCACVGVFFFNKCFLYKFHGMQVSRKLVVQVFGIEVRTVGRKKEERCDCCLVALLKRQRKWCVHLFSKTPFLFICGPASARILPYNFSPYLHPSFSPVSTVQFDSVLVLKTSKRRHF